MLILNIYIQIFVNLHLILTLFIIFINNNIENLFGPGGLIYTIFYFFLMNAFLTPLINFIDPAYIIKKLKQIYYCKIKSKYSLTQMEANKY